MDKTLVFFDTEFIEDGKTIELLSIGMVADDGRELYLENKDADTSRASDWVRTNVLPQLNPSLHGVPKADIRDAIISFANKSKYPVRFIAYYADYDWVVLCQLFGAMVNLPSTFPKWAYDLKQLCVSLGNPPLLAEPVHEHHALCDARWNRDAYYDLLNRKEQ